MGLERLMLLMETQKTPFPQAPRCDLYIASMGDKASVEAVKIVASIREDGMSAQYDLADRSVKAQMKYANKLGARYTMVLGDNELETGKAILKNMESGETQEVALSTFAEDFMGLVVMKRRINSPILSMRKRRQFAGALWRESIMDTMTGSNEQITAAICACRMLVKP